VAGSSLARGAVLWEPPADAWETSRLGAFARWLVDKGVPGAPGPGSYEALWSWSVSDLAAFWGAVQGFFELGDPGDPPGPVLVDRAMPGARWFPSWRGNYAGALLEAVARVPPEQPVLRCWSESTGAAGEPVTAGALLADVAALQAALVELGVGRGGRVAAVLGAGPEAVVGLLATTSLGATWSSLSPELGPQAALDRLGQFDPQVLLCVEAYRYGGKVVDRRELVGALREGLGGLRATVLVPTLDAPRPGPGLRSYPELLAAHRAASAAGSPAAPPRVEPVPFDHPLWVLYSSGSTGRPKAIVQGHGGILLEHAKALGLHQDLRPGERFLWYTTTGWMMWNYLVSGLLLGAEVCVVDGSPTWPDLGVLWRLAAEARLGALGVSAGFLDACRRAGLERELGDLDLGSLRVLGSTGSPLSATTAAWAAEVTGGAQVASISGGTDVCTAFLGPAPVLPVRAGELSCAYLGCAAEALADGQPVRGEQGELVVLAPMPSMPLGLLGDPDGQRLRATYYAQHPGAWTHGDAVVRFEDGAWVVLGRSDATLNRGGVRLGTAEFYEALDQLPELTDHLVVHLEDTDELVLLVALADGVTLDDTLERRIREHLRRQLSPRHVPDQVHALPALPRTLTGKRLEVPAKRILQGADPEAVAAPEALADPRALPALADLARRRRAERAKRAQPEAGPSS
jgi:acetoacetyl-CoA synthetase